MNIIGLTSDRLHHDSSVCLVRDGKVVFACSEERYSRIKNDPRAPIIAITDVLERYDLTFEDIHFIAIGMPRFRTMKGMLSANLVTLFSILAPIAIRNPRHFFKYVNERILEFYIDNHGFEWLKSKKIHYICHYLSHASSAYRTSGFNEGLCFVLDAAGCDEAGVPLSGAIYKCQNGKMNCIETISRFTSIGCFYNAVTQALAFKTVGEDWKLMGLSAYGDPLKCYNEIKVLSPQFEGDLWVKTRYTIEAKLIDRPKFLRETLLWKKLMTLVDQYGDVDVAAAAQKIFEDQLLRFFSYYIEREKPNNIALAGGVFQNIKFNMRLKNKFPDLNIFIHPAAGDSGTSVGSALELYNRITDEPVCYEMNTIALGPEYSTAEMEGILTKYSDDIQYQRPTDLAVYIAKHLADQKVIGLFLGRSEWGPRALGQRSVIADPRDKKMRDFINSMLKNREWFMPFAPSILEEDAPLYLKNYFYSPFMTHAFEATDLAKKNLQAAIHVDGTTRPQIVRKKILPEYYSIISEFKKLTQVGAVLNTSFNHHGIPIVNSPEDAVKHLIWGCVDILVIGPFWVERKKIAKKYLPRIDFRCDQMIKKWEPFDKSLQNIFDKRKEKICHENR